LWRAEISARFFITRNQQKNDMKQLLFSILLIAFGLCLSAQHLYVLPIGGEQVAFALEHKPKITFNNGTKTIQSTEKNETFQLSNIQNLSFKFNQPTNNRPNLNEQTNPLQAWITNDVLHIGGLTIGKPYRIYNLLGLVVYNGIATADVETRFIASLQNGIYIIHSENQSLKIIKY
jgi:hypothetical protein